MTKARMFKLAATFSLSVLACGLLAVNRPGDLAHVLGTASARGGRVAHGVDLVYGDDRYTVLVTGRSRLPETADFEITVEGDGAPPWAVYSSFPAGLDLGVHDWPEFTGTHLLGVQPGDKFGLWVVLTPSDEVPLPTEPPRPPLNLAINLYDDAHQRVMSVPVSFHDANDLTWAGAHSGEGRP